MGGTPNGLKQFFVQGRTTIKKHVFPNCLRSSSIMEGEMDFHAWVGSKIYSWMFYGKFVYHEPIVWKFLIVAENGLHAKKDYHQIQEK
ncbi:hypothetical protein UM396_01805 [Geobacillus subterraneus]|uniref:hypothetical protein n=1 Tax=Geobacillus subterraneus TaxID=129338 RepID=UPI002AC8E427|nr:hypothetical protein [Geobacillus subterraneus]WPZ18709.1 hypothetical protein UM396_01805 [Geobacillus subterraneus]